MPRYEWTGGPNILGLWTPGSKYPGGPTLLRHRNSNFRALTLRHTAMLIIFSRHVLINRAVPVSAYPREVSTGSYMFSTLAPL